MEIDLATLILPEFEGLDSISPKGKRAIEKAHLELTKLAGNHRRIAYQYGEAFLKIRDVLLAEGKGECCASYCRSISLRPDNFRECIYIYEAFVGNFDLLQQFPLTVQRLISRPSGRHLLEKAFAIARTGEEVTQSWIDSENGVVESQKKMPPPDDDLDDDEDRDLDRYLAGDDDEEDEQDTIPIERRKDFRDSLLANTLAIEDPEEARDELCKILIADVQTMKKRLSMFVHERKIYGGRWYGKLEGFLDQLMSGIEELQRTAIVHTGE